MVFERKTIGQMNQESIDYLVNNTNITYVEDGGYAVSLLKSANNQIASLQDKITLLLNNTRLSTANGVFLDMIGELLNIRRLESSRGIVDKSEANIKFYVTSGNLGSFLRHPNDQTKGLIPVNTRIFSSDQSIAYQTTEDTIFPRGAKAVYVSAVSLERGGSQSIGANKLIFHNLGASQVLVTNEKTISNARDLEDDDAYRYRISNAVFTLAGGNRTSIETAALSFQSVQNIQFQEYARGAGTFDVLVIPTMSKLGESTKRQIDIAVNRTKAFGVSSRIKEPDYISICMSIQISFYQNVQESEKISIRDSVRNNIKLYLQNIPIGGEIIINQIRSAAISVGASRIRDITIIDFCFDGKPILKRNIKLAPTELIILDETKIDPIQII